MNNRITLAASRAALAVGLAFGASSAFAQANPAPAPSGQATTEEQATAPAGEGEIVVTAQFREQNLQDTPLAITAVNAAMLEARSQTNIAQVANQAPSVTLKPQGSAYGPALGANIRGVGQFDFNPALEPGVGFYVDDVYYATLTGSILDLLDLDRVEILRGPQGTLAGRNSIGGAVKLYSKKPTGSNTGTVSAAYGSGNRLDLRASADFNLGKGIDLRLAGVSKRQDGYVKRLDFGCVYPAGGPATYTPIYATPTNPTLAPMLYNPAGGVPARVSGTNCLLGKEGEVGFIAGRAQLRIRPTDTVDINLIADYTNDDRNAAPTVILQRNFPDGSVASPRFPIYTAIPAPGSTPAQNYVNATAATRDINPFAAANTLLFYDNRFLCGQYCNYATYDNPADGIFKASTADGRVRFRGWGVSAQIEWDIGDSLNLNSITAYRTYTSYFSNDNDASPLAHSLGYGNLDFDFFSQELRLNGKVGDALEYTLGGYYSDQRSIYQTFQDLRYAGNEFQGYDPVDADSKAAFAHVAWHPIDALTLTGGIRYTEESKTYTYGRFPVYNDPTAAAAAGTVLALNGVVGKYNGHRFDYRANIQYEFTRDIMAYAQYSTGFKGGGVNPRPFFKEQAVPFRPETLTSYEVGMKNQFFGRRMRLNLAAFFSQYKDIILSLGNCAAITGSAATGTPCAMPVNAGSADMKGIEVETAIYPVDGLSIDGSLSYLDFKYKTFNTFTDPNGTVRAVGGPANINAPQFGDYPPFTPRWKWSAGIQYEIPLGAGAGSITPRFDASYQGTLYTAATNRPTNRIDDYILSNARVTWRNADRDLEVSLEVTNLFDKYYLVTIFDQTTAGVGYATGQPGRPREWAVSVKKKF
jgi:iron complex outermembrane receptor protein